VKSLLNDILVFENEKITAILSLSSLKIQKTDCLKLSYPFGSFETYRMKISPPFVDSFSGAGRRQLPKGRQTYNHRYTLKKICDAGYNRRLTGIRETHVELK
jgi:hypothetical protein